MLSISFIYFTNFLLFSPELSEKKQETYIIFIYYMLNFYRKSCFSGKLS